MHSSAEVASDGELAQCVVPRGIVVAAAGWLEAEGTIPLSSSGPEREQREQSLPR